MYRQACARGALIRLQKTRFNHSIIGWLLLARITAAGTPDAMVTTESIREAGCAHLSKKEYIASYCMAQDDAGVVAVAQEVVVLYFARIWDRNGREVRR
jgi:hypothetical protein